MPVEAPQLSTSWGNASAPIVWSYPNEGDFVEDNRKMLSRGYSDRTDLQKLNERFAAFIEKVRSLELHNTELKGELNQVKTLKSQGTTNLFQRHLKKLQEKLDQKTKELNCVLMERNNLKQR
ncbi:hypothetical protein NDU88_001095 [Pleurodeles waltl]|uniref:IF rod domain-containing protein n=2 Tax=Pleurodeles waltl TaxID=8319 RepID=A0AAV7S7Y2_PLEWA|nr:hypothetical protein NDU88_001095 [Pleurodeles waltl]